MAVAQDDAEQARGTKRRCPEAPADEAEVLPPDEQQAPPAVSAAERSQSPDWFYGCIRCRYLVIGCSQCNPAKMRRTGQASNSMGLPAFLGTLQHPRTSTLTNLAPPCLLSPSATPPPLSSPAQADRELHAFSRGATSQTDTRPPHARSDAEEARGSGGSMTPDARRRKPPAARALGPVDRHLQKIRQPGRRAARGS